MLPGRPLVLLPLALLWLGCGPDIYSIPDPPPEESWVDLSESAEEDEQVKLQRTLAAKNAALDLYEALDKARWQDAVALMSQETRNFLDDASSGRGAASALSEGVISIGGKTLKITPIEAFFIADMVNIKDEVPGAPPEAETRRRKELYAISRDGRARKLVFIFEADAWRLHSPVLGDEPFPLGG